MNHRKTEHDQGLRKGEKRCAAWTCERDHEGNHVSLILESACNCGVREQRERAEREEERDGLAAQQPDQE